VSKVNLLEHLVELQRFQDSISQCYQQKTRRKYQWHSCYLKGNKRLRRAGKIQKRGSVAGIWVRSRKLCCAPTSLPCSSQPTAINTSIRMHDDFQKYRGVQRNALQSYNLDLYISLS